ncbi:MAG: hypothetical protein KF681_05880 [Bdellovibrionaceae bacterium]|nr:hypothetical protein [Pseudobdellovibrionaceae bacterium]
MVSRFILSAALVLTIPAFAKDEGAGVAPEAAHQRLVDGNKRFTSEHGRKDGRSRADVRKLEAGQKPHTIVLSCSDSRVPPETVFDQGLGEIFTVRVAGEALDTSVIASIEYAVEHLGARLILVMGHTHCGAVKAAIATKTGSAGSPSLDALVKDIKPRLPASTSADVAVESAGNAKGVASDLLKRSAIIREKVTKGEVKIESALYHLNDGHVDWQ